MATRTTQPDAPSAEAPALPALPTIITAYDLMRATFLPTRWMVPGLLPDGLTLLAGKPKMGKSWLALELAIAVATGGVALGQIPVEPGDVLYLALEDNWS